MRIVTFILIVFLAITACNKKGISNFLIPQDEFIDILVELHIVDGFYMMNYNNMFHHNDTSNFYNEIIKEHGYTRAYFDSTLKYYSAQPKELDEIYDDVVTELNKLQQEASLLQQYGSDSSRNLFKKKTRWSLPRDGEREMIPFKIAIKDTGLYTILVQLKLFEDDQSENLHLTAFFWYDDSTRNGYMDYFPGIRYKISDRFVVVSAHKRNSNKKVTHIKGYILNHDNKYIDFEKRVEVKSIIVTKD